MPRATTTASLGFGCLAPLTWSGETVPSAGEPALLPFLRLHRRYASAWIWTAVGVAVATGPGVGIYFATHTPEGVGVYARLR